MTENKKQFTVKPLMFIEEQRNAIFKKDSDENLTIREVCNELNALYEKKEDWKIHCLSTLNENSILWNEIFILREQGAETSEAFKEYCKKNKPFKEVVE